MTAFISGHTDLSEEEFIQHYIPQLDSAIENKCQFVVGNARGADQLALNYLREKKVDPSVITLYCHPTPEKNKFIHFGIRIVDGFPSYNQRDIAMTRASTYDIAWVRKETPEESKIRYGADFNPKRISATQANVNRRQKKTTSKRK